MISKYKINPNKQEYRFFRLIGNGRKSYGVSEIQLFEVVSKEYAQRALTVPSGVTPGLMETFRKDGISYFKDTGIPITGGWYFFYNW